VVDVTWYDACMFALWVGGRLPTEAEWEYACRAGTTTEYSFGDDPKLLDEYGWYYGNSGTQTQPVGAKKPNPWGLYDMHGNVWEWTRSDYRDRTRKVVRGGSWYDRPMRGRSAFQLSYNYYQGVYNVGFRVVMKVGQCK